MSIKSTLLEAKKYLENNSPSPDIDALYLMMHILQKDSSWIFVHSEDHLNEQQNLKTIFKIKR